MKKAMRFSSAVVLSAMGLAAAPALAADLGVPVRPVAPAASVAVSTFNWSGCYIGGHIGGGSSRNEFVNTANVRTGATAFGDLGPGNGYRSDASGVFGGGQLGCNYQTGPIVYGIEGTASGTGFDRTFRNDRFTTGNLVAFDDVFTHRINWIGTVTGRLGYAADNWLLYVKGGYAGADVSFKVVDADPPITGSGSDRKWHNGWTLGGGIDFGLTPNWIVGVEGNYYRFDTKSHDLGGGTQIYTFDFRPRDVYSVVGRLSYKFGNLDGSFAR